MKGKPVPPKQDAHTLRSLGMQGLLALKKSERRNYEKKVSDKVGFKVKSEYDSHIHKHSALKKRTR